jgi:putative PIN family toxin of toxin-antitoxin system
VRIVLDTNVPASALLSASGAPAAVLQLVLAGRVVLCFDARIMTEYREVLRRRKFDFDPRLVDDLLEFLQSEGELVGAVPLPISLPDPDDAMFLEVASAGGADYVVTGNIRHFPNDARHGIPVVSPGAFVEIIIGER